MLKRWVPPTDEGTSMLRLLKLLTWPHPQIPELLCGPLHNAVLFFSQHAMPTEMKPVWKMPRPDNPIHLCLSWRISLLTNLLEQGSIIRAYFPMNERRSVISCLYTCLDSMFPLLTAIEESPTLTLEEIYRRQLAPEHQRHSVIDYSCTRFIGDLIPYILTDMGKIPAAVLEDCGDDLPKLELLLSLLRQLTIQRDKVRGFLRDVFDTLRGESNWLANTIVIIFKYALLGNYPGASAFLEFKNRRIVYNLTNENVMWYLTSCSGPRLSERENELCITLVLLSTALNGIFETSSVDYCPLDDLVTGWKAFATTNQRVLSLIVNFYPVPPPANLVNEFFRKIVPLKLIYRNSFYYLHSINPQPVKIKYWQLVLPFLNLLRVPSLYMAILAGLPLAPLMKWKNTDSNEDFSLKEWNRLCSLASFLVDRWAFSIIDGSQALYFEQAARMLKITTMLSPEKSTILYCEQCGTVRVRPVGSNLPSSHITMCIDMNFMQIHCVDCDGKNITPINMLGRYVRCYLTNKKGRELVNLALCSACMHICTVGYYNKGHGVICSECLQTVTNLQLVAKSCLNCLAINNRVSDTNLWTTLDPHGLQVHNWCNRCIPPTMINLKHKNTILLSTASLKDFSLAHYETPLHYRPSIVRASYQHR